MTTAATRRKETKETHIRADLTITITLKNGYHATCQTTKRSRLEFISRAHKSRQRRRRSSKELSMLSPKDRQIYSHSLKKLSKMLLSRKHPNQSPNSQVLFLKSTISISKKSEARPTECLLLRKFPKKTNKEGLKEPLLGKAH